MAKLAEQIAKTGDNVLFRARRGGVRGGYEPAKAQGEATINDIKAQARDVEEQLTETVREKADYFAGHRCRRRFLVCSSDGADRLSLMLATLIASMASGEIMDSMRRAKSAAVAYFLAAIAILIGMGFLIARRVLLDRGHIRDGLHRTGFWRVFILLAIIIIIAHRLSERGRKRLGKKQRRSHDVKAMAQTAVKWLSCRPLSLGAALVALRRHCWLCWAMESTAKNRPRRGLRQTSAISRESGLESGHRRSRAHTSEKEQMTKDLKPAEARQGRRGMPVLRDSYWRAAACGHRYGFGLGLYGSAIEPADENQIGGDPHGAVRARSRPATTEPDTAPAPRRSNVAAAVARYSSVTPAARIFSVMTPSEPPRSIARHPSSTTLTLKPSLTASSAENRHAEIRSQSHHRQFIDPALPRDTHRGRSGSSGRSRRMPSRNRCPAEIPCG